MRPLTRIFSSKPKLARLLFPLYWMFWGGYYGDLVRFKSVASQFQIKPGNLIFDAGCGSGLYCLKMALEGASMVGGDITPEQFRYSQSFAPRTLLRRIDFLVMDLRYIPIKSGVFDKTISIDVLEHIPEYEDVLSELTRVLKEDGEFIIHVPHIHSQSSLKNRVRKNLSNFDQGHVRAGYTLDQLVSICEEAGMRVHHHVYTFGYYAHIAHRLSRIFKNSVVIFPFTFFLAELDRNKRGYMGSGLLIKGRKASLSNRDFKNEE